MAQRPGLNHRISTLTQSKTVVLVTGANQGIGLEIVRKLSTEHASYQILLGSRDVQAGERAAASLGALSNVNPIQLDVTSDESIANAAKAIEQNFGKLDVLINNAGTAGRTFPKDWTPRQKWQETYNVNVVGAALLTDALAPLLEKAASPRVVFVSSVLGSMSWLLDGGGLVDVPWYNSSKSAMNMVSAYYSRKFPRWKSNACCPGYNATNLNGEELTEELHPRNGAINACRLATLGEDGETGTYSQKEGPLGW